MSDNPKVKPLARPAGARAGHAGCISCTEKIFENECARSTRDCGHHCNCSWTRDLCCWCGERFDGGAAA